MKPLTVKEWEEMLNNYADGGLVRFYTEGLIMPIEIEKTAMHYDGGMYVEMQIEAGDSNDC